MYVDRADAGRQLADFVAPYISSTDHTIVLGLSRGGVPIAYEIAVALKLPLDVMNVRKIGHVHNPELAIGSITHDGQVRMMGYHGASDYVLWKEMRELERRNALYRYGRPPLETLVRGKTVILCDDGIATGSTILASIACLRRWGARKVIVAAPVAASDSINAIYRSADKVVVPLVPLEFDAVGQFFKRFGQVTDDEVLSYLR